MGQFTVHSVSGLQEEEEHHNVTSFLDGRRAATETLGVGEPGRQVMQLPPSYSKTGSRIYLEFMILSSVVIKSIGREVNSWIIGDI